METSTFCPVCGTAVSAHDQFCAKCGTPRSGTISTFGVVAETVTTKPVQLQIELAFRRFISRFAQFSGRAPANELWWMSLLSTAAGFALQIVSFTFRQIGVGLLSGLFSLAYVLLIFAIIIPSCALAVRRLHDTNRSGWWLLIALVPIIGPIVLIVFYALPSQPVINKWGAPDPL